MNPAVWIAIFMGVAVSLAVTFIGARKNEKGSD